MIIGLNKQELIHGGITGMFRHIESVLNNRKPRFKERYTGELLGFHMHGAMAEMAFCKAFGLFWDYSVNTFHKSDISGHNIEIRYSRLPYLKVRPDDNDILMVSITGELPTFKIMGYIDSEDAKKDEYLKDFGNRGVPAYFVPHECLLPSGDLYTQIYSNKRRKNERMF